MNMHEVPEPSAAADEVLIRVAYAGICGSELGGYLGHNALRKPPLVMGHEFSGEIVALGDQAHSVNPALTVGANVTVNPLVACGECALCVRGLKQLCTTRKLIGAARPGGFAELVNVPANLVTLLPDGMTLETGALTEPVAVGVRIGELAGKVHGEVALVVGAGPIGLLALQALQARGVRQVFISDLDPERLAMGAALGGEALNPRDVDVVQTVHDATDGYGAAVAVEAVGAGVTRAQAIAGTRSAGTVVLTGLHEESSPMPVAEVIRREITLRGAFAYTPANFADALGRLEREEMHLAPWIVHAPLAEGGMWFERLINSHGNAAKVLLVP
jgi:threonine dehydrogenase-like Zn-dependent dehydrogenase